MTKILLKISLQIVCSSSTSHESHLLVGVITQCCKDMKVGDAVQAVTALELKSIPSSDTGKDKTFFIGFFSNCQQFVQDMFDSALVEGGVNIFQSDSIRKNSLFCPFPMLFSFIFIFIHPTVICS